MARVQANGIGQIARANSTNHLDVVTGVVALNELLALEDRVVHLIGSKASAGCEEESAVVGPLERLVALLHESQ